jgi:hypothetical protein
VPPSEALPSGALGVASNEEHALAQTAVPLADASAETRSVRYRTPEA